MSFDVHPAGTPPTPPIQRAFVEGAVRTLPSEKPAGFRMVLFVKRVMSNASSPSEPSMTIATSSWVGIVPEVLSRGAMGGQLVLPAFAIQTSPMCAALA